MARRKPQTDWTTAPRLDAPVRTFDGAIGSTCVGGPDTPGHSSAGCPVFSWAAPRGAWWVCACDCHTTDLADDRFVVEVKQERIAADRSHRLAYGF